MLCCVVSVQDIWLRAVEIARSHVPNKLVEVALEVSRRLVSSGREEAAADVLFDVGRQDEAISVCLAAKKFDKAKALAAGSAGLRRRVEDSYQGHLVEKEDTGELVELGRSDVALDVLAKRGDWER